MRGKIALFMLVLLVLPTLIYADNLRIRLYQETDAGKTYGNIDVKPGQLVEATVEIENENTDREDKTQDIKDIEVKLKIDNILEGKSDFEEEFKKFDLRPRRTEDLDFNFRVPLRVERKSYELQIDIKGEENKEKFSLSDDFMIDVKKEKNNLTFQKLEFSPSTVECNDATYLDIQLIDLGSSDEDVDMELVNSLFGVSLSRGFLLEPYPGNDMFIDRFPIKVPADIKPGKYPFEITLKSNNLIDKATAVLDVTCNGVASSDSSDTTTSGTGTTTTTTNNQGSNDDMDIRTTQNPPKSVTNPPEIVVDQGQNTSIIILSILAVLIIIAIIAIVLIKRR